MGGEEDLIEKVRCEKNPEGGVGVSQVAICRKIQRSKVWGGIVPWVFKKCALAERRRERIVGVKSEWSGGQGQVTKGLHGQSKDVGFAPE